MDTFTGTAGNETITAALVFDSSEAVTTASTLSVSDIVVGGAGTDVLNFSISGAQDAGVTIPAANISGVETFNVRNTVTQTATLDATNFAGLTTANSDRSVGALTVTGLTSAASGGIIGDGTVTNGASSFGWGATVTAGTVNVSGGTVGTGVVTTSGTLLAANTVNSSGAANAIGALTLGAAVKTLNVNATSALTTGAVSNTTAAALTTINVTGSAAVNLSTTAQQSTVTTIDASAATGALTVALGSAVTQKVTGGSGADVITAGAVLTTGSVNGGDGVDTLVSADMSYINTKELGAKYTNFETLRLTHATANTLAMDSTLSGITAIEIGGPATLTQLNATQAANIRVRSNASDGTADALSVALFDASGKSDVLNIIAGQGTTNTSATDIAALTLTGFETLNVQALAGPTSTAGAGGANDRTTNITGTITGANLTKINLTGSAVKIANIAIANATAATTIDGSALTGDGASTPVGLTVAGNAVKGSTIIGSGVKDSFTIGAEGATYQGGAGNDLFITTTALATADGTNDLVMEGGAGTSDTLQLTTFSDVTDAAFTNVTGMEALVLDAVSTATTVVKAVLGAAARTAFADGVTVTSGTTADGAKYTFQSGLYNKNVKLTAAVSADGATSADDVSITTGSGDDTISLTASSWVGNATTGGAIGVTTGAGVDNISVTIAGASVLATGVATITAGTGADIIKSTGINAVDASNQVYVIAAGDSTVTAYDSITGFDAANGTLFSSTLDFDSVRVTAYSATTATGYTSGELTVAVSSAGLVTFAGTSAAGLTLAQKISALQSVVITTAGDSALFTHGSNAYVFNNNATSDSLVELVGLSTATSLIATNATTANAIFIA